MSCVKQVPGSPLKDSSFPILQLTVCTGVNQPSLSYIKIMPKNLHEFKIETVDKIG